MFIGVTLHILFIYFGNIMTILSVIVIGTSSLLLLLLLLNYYDLYCYYYRLWTSGPAAVTRLLAGLVDRCLGTDLGLSGSCAFVA